MPYRTYSREQDWLLPPSLGELLAVDHPVRFVAEFVDQMDLAQVGISAEPAVEGAPSYHPKVLLAAWLYGFMVRVRSSRKLERACAENIAFMWLTAMQRPDHVTLWRFYKANRQTMRGLLKRTVHLAMEVGLVDFALQAVDGSRMALTSGDSLRGRKALQKLLAAVEGEIAGMEQTNQAEDGPEGRPPKGPQALRSKRELRARIQQALAVLDQAAPAQNQTASPAADSARAATGAAPAAPKDQRSAEPRVSATDPAAVIVKGRHGFSVGYNGQAVVDSKAQIITAADVVASASDRDQLVPMLQEAVAMTGRQAAVTAADTGYFAMPQIIAAAQLTGQVFVPDQRERRADGPSKNPFHKQHFIYNAETDTFTCPLEQVLTYAGDMHDRGQTLRMYEGRGCGGCPAQLNQSCTKAKARRIKITGLEQQLREHASHMATELAKQMMHQRAAVVEPVFASIRERIGLQRFLLRGLENVTAEWRLACTAHNLLKLWKHWWRPRLLEGLAST